MAGHQERKYVISQRLDVELEITQSSAVTQFGLQALLDEIIEQGAKLSDQSGISKRAS